MAVANLKNLVRDLAEERDLKGTAFKVFEILTTSHEWDNNRCERIPINERLDQVNKLLTNTKIYKGGYFGVEAVEHKGEFIEYLNTGDLYNLTIYHYKNKFHIGCVADILER